jgi:hypothetical protein
MKESATARTPVEIWRHIFQLAIKTHLHDYDNNSIVHDLDLFVFGCKSGRQYIESERNRMNLRLVCRSWNSVLQDAGDRLMMVELTINGWPSKEIINTARRIELIRQSSVRCSCTKLPCSLPTCLNQYPTSQIEPNGFLDGEYSHLEGLLAQHASWFGQKLPEHAPALRLLSWSLMGQHYGTNYSTLPNLTHLCLHGVCHNMLMTIVDEISMPKVTMLWLDFVVEAGICLKPCTILTGWRFPKLNRLMLSGTCRPEIWSDIKGLISACRITLHELGVTMRISWKYMGYSPSRNPLDEVLDNLPNLVTFGTAQQAIWEDSPPPSLSVKPTWSLLLFHTLTFGNFWASTFERMVLEYGVGKVIFDNTWQDIHITMEMDNQQYHSQCLKTIQTAFDTMEEEGILVCDVNGVLSTESYGRVFLSWLTPRTRMPLEDDDHPSLADDIISNTD